MSSGEESSSRPLGGITNMSGSVHITDLLEPDPGNRKLYFHATTHDDLAEKLARGDVTQKRAAVAPPWSGSQPSQEAPSRAERPPPRPVLTGAPIPSEEGLDWSGSEKTAVTKLPPATPNLGNKPPIVGWDAKEKRVEENQTKNLGPRRALEAQTTPGNLPQQLSDRQDDAQNKTDKAYDKPLLKARADGLDVRQSLLNLPDIRELSTKIGMDFSAYETTNPFDDPEIDPIYLDLLLIKSWGRWFDWDPETLWMELKNSFGVQNPTRRQKDMILALQTAHVSDRPYQEWENYARFAAAVNRHDIRFDEIPELSPAEAAYGAAVLMKIRKNTFSSEVQKYLAAICLHDGLLVAPYPLEFVQGILDKRLEKSHPELIPAARQIQEAISKDWGPVSEDTIVSEQLRRLGAMKAFVKLRLAGRPSQGQ